MFSNQTFDAYQYMIPLCLYLGKSEEALDYTERGKSSAFLGLLAATELRPTVKLTNELKSLLHQEQICLDRWRTVQTCHLKQTKISPEPGEIESIRKTLDQIYNQIEEIDPQYAYIRKGSPLTFKGIQNLLCQQKRNAILVEYFATEDKAYIFIFPSKDKELHVRTVPLSMRRLYNYTISYVREVIRHSDFADIGQTWTGLSKYLIDPISEYLTDDALIYLVPYGIIHYLPLHVLEFKGEPLIKKHPVAYLPSASILTFCQNKGSGNLKTCASFGVVFEEEAEDIAELFGSRAFSGSSISKDIVVQTCTNKDIIHFSCHGFFDDIDPLSSGIVLNEKATSSPPDRREILTAREIFDMRLNTELVTLSACETGVNKRSPGDELIGLTRAFLYAGAPSVVVSLWSVDARSTHDLMVEFYRNIKKGLDKATALQEAQKTIMEEEEYSHPYYWAPFILVGDWE
jgi:CHAT domain-containing protein